MQGIESACEAACCGLLKERDNFSLTVSKVKEVCAMSVRSDKIVNKISL